MQARFYFSLSHEKTLGIWLKHSRLSNKHKEFRALKKYVKIVIRNNYRNSS